MVDFILFWICITLAFCLNFTLIYIVTGLYLADHFCLRNNVFKVILGSIQVKLIAFSNLNKSIQDIYIPNINPLKFYQHV